MFLCTPFAKRLGVLNSLYTAHSSCADSPDRDWRFTLITEVSVIKRLSLCEFTLWGRNLVSVVCIRKRKKIYEKLVGTLETVRNREVSVTRGSTVLAY